MRKALLYSIAMLILVNFALAADVSRSMPSKIEPGKSLEVVFKITGMEKGKIFTLQDKMPFKVTEWVIEGAKEPKDKIDYKSSRNGWSFTADSSTLKIKYYVDIPSDASGDYTFDATWFSPSGIDRNKATLKVAKIACGDGICEGNETSTCPKDCPAIVKKDISKQQVAPGITGAAVGTKYSPTLIGILVVAAIVIAGIVSYFVIRKKK